MGGFNAHVREALKMAELHHQKAVECISKRPPDARRASQHAECAAQYRRAAEGYQREAWAVGEQSDIETAAALAQGLQNA